MIQDGTKISSGQDIQNRANSWKKVFQELADCALERFSKEPLDKKTAIVCTAHLISAMHDVANSLATILDEHHLHESDWEKRQPEWPDISITLEAKEDWTYQILYDACSASEEHDQMTSAHCHAYNAKSLLEAYRHILGKNGQEAATKFLNDSSSAFDVPPTPKD